MSVIQVDQIGKVYDGLYLWQDISFAIEDGEKVGLLGPNGCGKSTLIKALLGKIDLDEGEVFFAKERKMATVTQELSAGEEEGSLRDFLLAGFKEVVAAQKRMLKAQKDMVAYEKDPSALEEAVGRFSRASDLYERLGGYEMEAKIREVLFGLGFSEEDLGRPVISLSGGQKTRLSLARSLVGQPDILILDEPNNYLDLEALAWLESFLAGYKGAVLVVSHDRYFLDAVISRVLEFENHRLYSYQGNFSAFMEKKAQIIEDHNKHYEKQKKKIAQTESYIDKYKAGIKSKQARGRQRQLDRLERLEKRGEDNRIHMSFDQAVVSGRKVLEVKDLACGYSDQLLFKDLSFTLFRGERLGMIGPNGCGKTTLLKALIQGALGQKTDFVCQGRVRAGVHVDLGYFSQEHEGLEPSLTVMDTLLEAGVPDYETARRLLSSFGFSSDEEVYRTCGLLSGGEKSRLLMALLFFKKPNLLILDEPTNHLDIYARESLEGALADYPGSMIFVSHDRYFLKKMASRMLYFDQGVHLHPEGFSSYQALREKEKAGQEKGQQKKEKDKDPSYKKRQRIQTAKLNEVERDIEDLEARLEEVELALTKEEVYADPKACQAASADRQAYQEALEKKLEEWEKLMD